MLRFVAAAAVLATATAQASPVPPKKAPKEAMSKGRALVKKGDFAGAVKVFQAALEVAPEDAALLSELGLAAWLAGDLALAETSSRRSVALATSPALRAASLYNLGRLQEARGEKAAAIDSYRRSLEDRPSKTVRERLLSLDPSLAASLDPFAPAPLDGPFPALADFCKATAQRAECTARADPDSTLPMTFTCAPRPVGKKLELARAPWQGVTAFATTCVEGKDGNTFTTLNLALRLGASWWCCPSLEESLDTMRQTESAELESLEARDVVPGGAPELLVRTRTTFDYRGMSSRQRVNLRVAGIGPSGKPSATPAILLEQLLDESDEDGNPVSQSGGELEAVFLPDGQLEIKGPRRKSGTGLTRETLAPLLGKHPLAFP